LEERRIEKENLDCCGKHSSASSHFDASMA